MDKFDEAEKALKAQGTPFADILFKSAAASALIQAQNGQKGKNIVTTVVFQSGIAMYAHWREERLQKVHDNSAARALVIRDYEASHPEAEVTASATKANFFSKHPFKDASAPVVAVRNLLQELASNKDCDDLTPAAKTVLDGLRAKPIGDMSQSESLALSQYYSCKAQWKEALPYAEATAHGKSRTGPYYAVLLTVQQALDQYDPVLKTVEEASVEAPPEGQYMPYKVRALKRLKRDDEAKAAAEGCKASQNQGTGTLCMAEVGLTYAGEPLSQDENADGTDSAETKSLIDRILQAE
ncbi:MAG: hypothetical protein JF615_15965 [Asticcacaulis sp.]|nr:hypothetical protein [Asticcacaulis sp.]